MPKSSAKNGARVNMRLKQKFTLATYLLGIQNLGKEVPPSPLIIFISSKGTP